MAPVLLIDTCGSTGRVAIVTAEEPPSMLAERLLPGRETQERLMQAITEVLAESRISRLDLHALGVITGPGSFTGVRIGLAAVKGLAEALALPVVAFSRLRWLAETAFAEGIGGNRVSAWLDAGRSEIYAGDYARDNTGVHCTQEALWTRASLQGRAEIVVVVEPSLAEQLAGTVLLNESALKGQLVKMVAAAVRAGQFADPVLLEANYLRVPDAELALRARQAAAAANRVSLLANAVPAQPCA